MIIPVAWTIPVRVPIHDPHRRADLGEQPKLQDALEPRAAVWLLEGTDLDIMNAQRWAAQQEHPTRVDSWPADHPDILGAARTAALAGGADGTP